MVLLVSTALAHIDHTLYGSPRSPVDPLGLVNEAGRYFHAMRGWRFADEGITRIDFVANQDYVELPVDFLQPLAIDREEGIISSFEWTSHQEMIELRTTTPAAASIHFWGVVTSSTPAQGGAPRHRIDLYPMPLTSTQNALLLYYKRGWREVSSDEDLISLPSWCETLYIQVLRAFARGYEQEDSGTLDDRLTHIREGEVFRSAERTDGLLQRWYGTLRGGGAQRATWQGTRFDGRVHGPAS